MTERSKECTLAAEDLRSALKELKGYVDVTEEDLLRIYDIAQRHARERKTPKIRVRRAMTMEVVTIKKQADIRTAAELLTKHRISGMPVVDENDHVIGVIGEADILALAGLKREHGFKDIVRHLLGEPVPVHRKAGNTVGEVMSTPAITTTPDGDIRDVAAILDERRIKRLPVVDEQGRIVGVISRADIIRILGQDVMTPLPKRRTLREH
jgi:CBS-domain-containing membrane protein